MMLGPRDCPPLDSNQPVLIQEKKRDWKPGVIIRKSVPNDFIVKANDTEYRRNRHMLKPMRMPSLDGNAAFKIKTSITDSLNTVVPSTDMEIQGDSSDGSSKDIPIQGVIMWFEQGHYKK
ncbi:hypothetical protein JTB14_032142 [Gonioctena quinquepunctata]|nr:hypothetical protein JTB14_032142 [Gonioctena quinquepunctata]